MVSWCFPVLRCFGCIVPIKADSICVGKIFVSGFKAGISEKIKYVAICCCHCLHCELLIH